MSEYSPSAPENLGINIYDIRDGLFTIFINTAKCSKNIGNEYLLL